MYSRSPRERETVNIPENYSGNAFRNNVYTDIVPNQQEKPTEQTSQDGTLPSVIESFAEEKSRDNRSSKSIFSSLLPNFSSGSRFPFGHGIGTEELFILGIMLLIYSSADEEQPMDSELLLLLCILLFSG